ncbi:MAG: Gfo/Idh/MocA family oxidoreductase [Saprospiraceae bacterium]|nr:Gfo/Idh/MocA family oxidoreductase [Saprospiraceae bacterium]
MEKQIQWGIIGVGDVCERKSGPAFQKVPGSDLLAVMRRNGEKARDFADRHGVPKWYDDGQALINDPGINAIYIATPPDSHAHYTRLAAVAGKPVYVEKPMARTYAECLEMIQVCEKHQVPLFVAYYRRALPNFLKIKELLEDQAIGQVRLVDIKLFKPLHQDWQGNPMDETNWRLTPEISGGGHFYDLASHQLDFLDFVLGPVVEAQGIAANQAGMYPAEDLVTGHFRFASGVIGQGMWCFTTGVTSRIEQTRIVGDGGEISFAYFGDPTVNLRRDGHPDEVFTFTYPPHIQQPLIQSIVATLQGVGSCPSTGESGVRTNWVMEMLVYGGVR